MSQTRIIEQDLWKDYKIIENTKVSIEKYLKDYEDLPNNEDKYRDIYKISEYFKNAPNSLEDFNDLIKKAEQKKTIEKQAEFERKKKWRKDIYELCRLSIL